MADTLADFQNKIDEGLKDPYNRIMVTISIAAMESPFFLDGYELDTLVRDIRALKAERDAAMHESGAVAALVEAAVGAHEVLHYLADEPLEVEALQNLSKALAPFERD